jgi:glyoxylase-like metal-dependent hydrolase (beta-lactamase superfamily II)
MQIAPRLHLLGGLVPAAAYVVETSEGLILVDAGTDSRAVELKKEMASLGLDWKHIRAIFLTHVHLDHIGGAQHLREATGATVYAGRGDAAVLRAGQPREAFFSRFAGNAPVLGPTRVDVELTGTEVIQIGEVSVRPIATPGHTPGSICYLMDNGLRKALFAGDVILSFVGDKASRSRLQAPLGIYSAYLPPRYRGDAAAFLSTLRRLRAMPVPDLVLPGHPRNDLVPQSPMLSQEGWDALLASGISELEELQARYDRDGAHFLDGVPCKLLPDLYYFGRFKGIAVYGFFASDKLFVVGAPGGSGLRTFLHAALQQLGPKPRAPTAVLLRSGNKQETAGLSDLVDNSSTAVVAPPEARAGIEALCPAGTRVLGAEDPRIKEWFSMEAIALRGRGIAPMAYLFRCSGKAVLFSADIPYDPLAVADQGVTKDSLHQPVDFEQYLASLERLGGLKPDLWLPAVPAQAQNAFLYGTEWKQVLKENMDLLRGKR